MDHICLIGYFSLAVNYLFLADCGCEGQVELRTEPFNALTEQNDYEVRRQV